MAIVSQREKERFGFDFVSKEFLPAGKDEYWLRNSQIHKDRLWRHLTPHERDTLIANNNNCLNWDNFLVSDPFNPSLVRNSSFYGLVRIGALRDILLEHHDFCVPAGIVNSTIISCDIGDDAAILNCSYISHYIIGDACILSCIDEMQATNHAKFGCGVVKDGEDESVRVWIDVMNEAGGRSILLFPGMLSADAYLWASYRDDTALLEKLKSITQKEHGGFRGAYGVVGSHSVIKSCRIIKDTLVGEWAYIKGANKLKNISVLSTEDEPSQIGEGVEMVNGILSAGSHAFYGVKAVRFFMGRCSSLKYGARLIHSVLGDNSTVSCCEILNNLIFPMHEQHHNNSFLIASLIEGMSNIAAGATIGSNHNSRANNGEIRAGRGFWPGLCTTLKHSSRFASFVLVAKGDYPNELNITLPFSLVNNNVNQNRLEIIPAYYWMHNLYALERNSWKAGVRDKRKTKEQIIETDYLAPDTVEEIINALLQMEQWIKSAGLAIDNGAKETVLSTKNFSSETDDPEHEIKNEDDVIQAWGLERHSRKTVIIKPLKAWAAYREMLLYYSLKTIIFYLEGNPDISYPDFVNAMEGPQSGNAHRVNEWVNLGGQIVPAFRIDDLRKRIGKGDIDTWKGIHAYYDEMASYYSKDRLHHAWEVFRYLNMGQGDEHPLKKSECLKKEIENFILLRRSITEQVLRSRAKDFEDPFGGITFRNKDEMKQVLGTAESSPFGKLVQAQTKLWEKSIEKLLTRFS